MNVNCTPLELIPFCRTRWGSWHGVLGCVLELRKVSNLIYIQNTFSNVNAPV